MPCVDLRGLSQLVLLGGGVIFILVGAMGVATSWFEFVWLYPVEIVGDEITVRNQQRFLKALELAWGIAILVLRRRVFVDPEITALVVGLFVITPASRLLSLALDGVPHPHFLLLLLVESGAAAVLVSRAVSTAGLQTPVAHSASI